ncbi:uncharacterized protein EI90DRAFT_3050884, partial [Cantharellus anzutake]|uniref:uncharacterized protein n=1 Tax=Cantharellus anzutake TaxID=1750568 RepID=UPI001903AD04
TEKNTSCCIWRQWGGGGDLPAPKSQNCAWTAWFDGENVELTTTAGSVNYASRQLTIIE